MGYSSSAMVNRFFFDEKTPPEMGTCSSASLRTAPEYRRDLESLPGWSLPCSNPSQSLERLRKCRILWSGWLHRKEAIKIHKINRDSHTINRDNED